ncbi:response regulator [Pseudomonas xanthosomatis]|uniref:GAF domain-containing hybrid sensor histidine kinase/response regulator n=1 Tax=Pseudomonas xanthosomatis TaxID=2842356 RepID=UPI001C3DE2D3|nr:ATP-binding protein [Pseudomonas xanthosomatis]QXH44040.1 response regulator [Pseudomonas xanthosomatis]
MKSGRHTEVKSANATPGFLLNGGAVSGLLQGMDWSSSPLGEPDGWSPGLKAVMATLLPAQAQIVLFWGAQYVALYNDAYSPTIGQKHPHALGQPALVHWQELWDDLEPLLRGVRETGETFSAKDRPFYIERSGFGETTYFDVSYSAVREADGSIGGVLCIVNDTTARVRFQRRQAFLLELGQTLPGLGEAELIEAHAVRRLAVELGAARVCFGEDLGDGQGLRVAREWAEGVPTLLGEHAYASFDPQLYELLKSGQQAQRNYLAEQAPPALLKGMGASLHVPVLRAERLEAVLLVHFLRPRLFAEDDCLLAEETAKQVWAAITHARAERALHMLNESLEERVANMLVQREASMLQLHEARKMEMIGQLTGGIAHDLNNMLTPIIASLELVRRQPDAQRAARLVDGGLQAAERARNLVGRLLSFARRQTLKPQAVALAGLVEEMRELIARSLGATISVKVRIDPQLPPVLVDEHQLELALLNLVINARDAMAEGGRLTITAGVGEGGPAYPPGLAAGQVWLQVADTGSGMSDEVLARCIEPFYSTKTVGKGAGLGLPMVQGLAVQSGGGFGICSQVGKGTQATLWLPPSEAGLANVTPLPAPCAHGGNRVLLVDDEPLVRQATLLQLRELGYEVTEADCAARALALLDAGLVPDVLLTDHVMTEMTGVRFAQKVRERLAELPVLIITGYANLSPRELHGFEVLRKPFRQGELAQSLAQLLARQG